jgi:hypothetical protein
VDQGKRELDEKQAHYEYIAFQIDREDNLVNQRLTWTLQLNGFLFAALALIGSEMDKKLHDVLLNVLPIAGFTVSFAGLLGVIAANLSMENLKSQWTSKKDVRWPRPFGNPTAFTLGLAPSVALPLVLSGAWLYIFLIY